MYDIKNKRKFLNRTCQPNLPAQLLIGTKLQIHSRQHCIVDYGDDKTRKVNNFFSHKKTEYLKLGAHWTERKLQYNAETWKYAIHRSNHSSSYKQRSQGNFIHKKITLSSD